MTTEHEATRTLVKSPPELWAECSDAASLARHLGEFGEIKITRLEPETAVAWEGERVSGTVRIEPSAWGTRVTLTAQMSGSELEEAVAEEVVAAPVEEVLEAEADVVADGTVVGREQVVGEDTELGADPEVGEDNVVVEQASVVADPVATVEAPAAEPVVAPGPKFGLATRIRAYFRRVLAVEVGTIPEPPELEVPGAPRPVAVEPVAAEPEPVKPEPEPVKPQPEPEPQPAPEPEPQAAAAEPEPALQQPAPAAGVQEPDSPPSPPQPDPGAVLTAALDSLGQAHHRPYSRA